MRVHVCLQIIGFPFFESQAIWIAQLLSGKKVLPSWEEMMKSIKEFYHSREAAGIPKHCTHEIANFEVKKLKIIHFSLMFFFTINLKGYLILVLEIFSIDQFSACLVSHYAHMFHITHRQQTITSTYFFKLTRKNLMTCACITYSITYLICYLTKFLI